jgi:hypothetical protein
MALNTPVDREFQIRQAGFVRDKIVLANFAQGLRNRTNPATGATFTEDEIQRALRPKSRFYIEAQAIDDYDQGEQRKALYLNDQIRIERASSSWLIDFHGRLEGETYLPASGASGTILVRGTPGTLVRGSTTPFDPSAYKARSALGTLYQVFTGTTIGTDGTVPATVFALTAGTGTNLLAPATLQWSNKDPNMLATSDLVTDLQGGTDRETDAEFASRLAGIKRFRPGAGNDSNFRSWTRSANNSIEEGWVYPNALYAGSTLIAVTEKRSGAVGPLGRVPTDFVLAQARAYLTTPGSAVVPGRAFDLVVSVDPDPVDAVVRISLQKGSGSGWADSIPFPSYHATTPSITALVGGTSQTDFTLQALGDSTLPRQIAGATLAGSSAPALMVWNAARSAFEKLSVSSIQDLGGNAYRVVLTAPPAATLAPGSWISPQADRSPLVAQAVNNYFDALGPGEIVDQQNDIRGGRCVRFPFAAEIPYRSGAGIANSIIDALGGSSAEAEMTFMAKTTPSLPVLFTNGPKMLVPGRFAIYPT